MSDLPAPAEVLPHRPPFLLLDEVVELRIGEGAKGRWHLTGDGRCRTCGTPVAGVYDGPPGEWGAKRVPVELKSGRARRR